jgi:hypothetical protein
MLLLGVGAAWELSMLVFQKHRIWWIVAASLEITLRAAAAIYLVLRGTIEVFQQRQQGLKPSIPSSLTRP